MTWRRGHGERGQILILTALSMTVLLATAALSIDASYMYDVRNKLHAASDAAAKGAAIERWRSGAADLQAFAYRELNLLGIDPVATGTTVTVRACDDPSATCSPTWGNKSTYVEVILSRQTSTFFGTILGWTSLLPKVRSVAGTSASQDCLVTCPNGNCGGGNALTVGNVGGGGSTINMPGCGVSTGGNLYIGHTSSVDASSVGISGTCTGPGGCPPNSSTGTALPTDPLAGKISPPPNPGNCTAQTVANNATLSLAPGCYTSITMNNNSRLYFTGGPGVYYVTGPITTGNSPTICLNAACTFDYSAGIMIYLTGMGSINLPNGTFMRLNAQTSGPYTGILIYQDPSDTNDATFNNGMSTFDLSGALYFPNASVTYGNSGSTNDCSLVVAKTLTLGNGTNEFSNTCSNYNGSPILTVTLAE